MATTVSRYETITSKKNEEKRTVAWEASAKNVDVIHNHPDIRAHETLVASHVPDD